MNVSLGRVLSTVAVAAGLTLATAGSASAETLAVADPQGDMVRYDPETDTTTPAPTVKNADILRTVFRHNARRIEVRVKYTELLRRGQMFSQGLQIVTNEGVRRDVSIYAGPHMWRGQTETSRPNGKVVECATRHSIDYDTNVVTLSLPRSCVSLPRWVRLGVGAIWIDNGSNLYGDDAQLDGQMRDAGLKLTKRLHRA